jgi:energy-coupling factor transporter ATP-binding protein EcfA2
VIGFSEGKKGAVDEETARRATAFQQNAATSTFKNKVKKHINFQLPALMIEPRWGPTLYQTRLCSRP